MTIYEKFTEFHKKNPMVCEKLIEMARYYKSCGHAKLSMKTLGAVYRGMVATDLKNPSHTEFALNNDYTSHYARFIMSRCPDLDGFFDTRALKTA